jgi:hypothetical protein
VEHGENDTRLLTETGQVNSDCRMELVGEVGITSTSRANHPPSHSNTVTLLQNIKKIAAQSRGILQDMTRQADLNADMIDSDDDEYRTPDPIQVQDEYSDNSTDKNVKYYDQHVNSGKQSLSTTTSNENRSSIRNEMLHKCETSHSSSTVSQTRNRYSTDCEIHPPLTATLTSSGDKTQPTQTPHTSECLDSNISNKKQTISHDSNEVVEVSSKTLSGTGDDSTKDTDLRMLDLYTQGSSDTILLLLVQRDTLKEAGYVNKLVSINMI